MTLDYLTYSRWHIIVAENSVVTTNFQFKELMLLFSSEAFIAPHNLKTL
jgi:hypothetical protein